MALPRTRLEKLKYLRIQQEDGTIYGNIPLTTDAQNITMQNGNDLQSTIGDIDYTQQDDITTNLRKMKGDLTDIISDIVDIKLNKADQEDLNNIQYAIQQIIADMQLDQPKILFDTVEGWASKSNLIGQLNTIYIYTNYQQDNQGNQIAGIKIGDGNAYLIDKPFLDEAYLRHINDRVVHITNEERQFWNNKVRCYYSTVEDEKVIFTTH